MFLPPIFWSFGWFLHVLLPPEFGAAHISIPIPQVAMKKQGDGGMDFTPLCKQQGCTFVLCPPANDRWHPWPFFKRFVDAAESLKTEFAAWRFFVALVDVPGWSDAETE